MYEGRYTAGSLYVLVITAVLYDFVCQRASMCLVLLSRFGKD